MSGHLDQAANERDRAEEDVANYITQRLKQLEKKIGFPVDSVDVIPVRVARIGSRRPTTEAVEVTISIKI